MKLINPSYQIIEQKEGLEGIYEQIELAGRVCYKSERKEGTTAKDFVDKLINRGHLSVLEHGTVYLAIPHNPFSSIADSTFRYRYNPYSKVVGAMSINPGMVYVTTNYRVLIENSWLDDLQYLCEPTEYHEKRVTIKLNIGVDISRELNRQRCLSVSEQSTRYCNFSKDKFGNEITCMIPCCLNTSPNYDISQEFKQALKDSEKHYFKLLELGWKPENARKVLPLDLATKVVYTAFMSDWDYIFSLRCSESKMGKSHPDCVFIMDKVKNEFIKREYIK